MNTMIPHNIMRNRCQKTRPQRHGAVAVYVAISITVVIGMAALAVDIGMLYSAQAEIQRTADAVALASAAELLGEEHLKGPAYLDILKDNARYTAVDAAIANEVLRSPSVMNSLEDMEFGYLSDLTSGESMVIDDPHAPNAVAVCVRRDGERGGSIALYFARFLGKEDQHLSAQATAAFADAIMGFEVTPTSGNAQLLPFTLLDTTWEGLLAGLITTGDNYAYNPDTGNVAPGVDGILELNLYPGAGADQLPPGSFGTVDIGSPNNSSADIARQILYGVSEDDLSYFGGRLELGPDGTLLLNGDTGLSAGFKDELEAIKGQPRVIPIFSTVTGNGENANYTIVGFVGIRIMNVKLTGRMTLKNVIIQPAPVIDDSAVAGPGPGPSHYVYRPVQLVR
jgi:hypothetical protein